MKKLLLTLMALLMSVSLASCSSSSTTETPSTTEATTGTPTVDSVADYTGPTEWVEATSREVQNMDYVATQLATDHELNANFVDGLLENAPSGEYVGAIAESWESNEDATVWTFHLRQGVNWVTSTGEVYDEVKAQDFVTGLRHGAEFASEANILSGIIAGYQEYVDAKDFSDEAFANVGVKAVDDYTVEYTMTAPTPYFYTLTTYNVLFPINEEFLTSKGTGCALGSPDPNSCTFGAASADSILYNGAYLLSVFDAKSQTVLVKNPNYWDADHVYLETVTRIYDDGSDPYSIITGFEQGTYVQAGLNASWSDYADYAEKYANNAYPELPNAFAFGVVFNYNRQIWDNTNYATPDEAKENTHNAILNENFRKALRAAYDKEAYLATSAPAEVAKSTLRNVNSFPQLVYNSEGVAYGDLITEAYNAQTGENVSLADGQDAFYDPEAAKEYIAAAEADGVVFPVHLDMLVIETSDRLVRQAQSMKQSIEENTDGQIIIELVLRDEDTVQNIAYTNTDPALADYDISTFTGWGPDYADPKTFVDIYSPDDGYYMTSIGLSSEFDGDQEIKEAIGLYEYYDLYQAADAITDDLDARYDAFALADAYLLEHAIYVPSSQNSRAMLVSRQVPFTRSYSASGISSYKYKYIQLQEDIVTVDEYNAAKAAWEGN